VLEESYAMIGVSVLCAETDEHAQWLAGPGLLSFVRLRSGRPGPFPTPEEAAAYQYTPGEKSIARSRMANQVIGSPETVRRGLDQLLADTGVDELMVTTMVHSHADRLRSYQLVAEMAGLNDRVVATPV
jgi:alkanesulfonate monooxygenase SsuD/methylene tetrahydromethanopterin reductase-like flavin-dependent oxidoreductase (luciferase family)